MLLILLLLGGQDMHGACLSDKAEIAACGTVSGKKQSDPQSAAVLSNAADGYRLFTTRPQRVLPTNLVKSQRTSGKRAPDGCDRLKQQYSRFKNFGGWPRQLSLPMRPFVSRYYYIIALRRIIR